MVAILTLAIAIAANAVVFSVLNALVLRPVPISAGAKEPLHDRGRQEPHHAIYPDYVEIRDRNRTLEGVTAFDITMVGLDKGQGSSRARLYASSGNYFDVLGIQPYLGRFFHPSDEHGPDSAPYVVLSYTYWQSHSKATRPWWAVPFN